MDTNVCEAPVNLVPTDTQTLCELLLQVAGRDTNRLPSVRHHAAVLAAAMPFMSKAQADVASQRIRRFETKWGSVLPGSFEEPEITAVSAELRVAEWLSMRRNSVALLRVLHRAASAIWMGATKLLDVQEYAYATELGRTLSPTTYDSFKEWMIQLRIADCRRGGGISPGSLCQWWVEQMTPTKRDDTSYTHCLAELLLLKTKPRY